MKRLMSFEFLKEGDYVLFKSNKHKSYRWFGKVIKVVDNSVNIFNYCLFEKNDESQIFEFSYYTNNYIKQGWGWKVFLLGKEEIKKYEDKILLRDL